MSATNGYVAEPIHERLTIVCGLANNHGGCRLTALVDGEQVHVDEINPYEKYKRDLFVNATWDEINNRFDVPEVSGKKVLWIGDQGAFEAVEQRNEPADDGVQIEDISTLIAAYPQLRQPIVGGLLRAGETANVIADPKRGKSWLAYGLALSVCTGIKWLDTFPCYPGRVLVIDNELHPATLAHRIPIVAEAMGIAADEYAENLDVLCLRGQLLDLYGIALALEAVEPGTYHLVILDAFYRSLPAGTKENANEDSTALYNLIDKQTARLNCAWVNVHHASKGSQATKSVTDVGAGAGAQSRAADTHLILREHEEKGAVVLEAAVRSFQPVKPLCLKWEFPLWRRDRP